MGDSLRIAIVNDLAIAREVLRRTVLSVPDYSIAWMAEDGESAVRMAQIDPPDAILMDLVMPGVDGVEATRRIMAHKPCPILLVTASVTGNFGKVMQAMGHGGIDAVPTPRLSPNGQLVEAETLLAKLEKIVRQRKAAVVIASRNDSLSDSSGTLTLPPHIVAFGASTGGPQAIAHILGELPKTFGAAILVALHIDAGFTSNLVKFLQDRSALPVKTAEDHGLILPGHVYVASSNDHLSVTTNRRLYYVREPVDYPFRPSVDVLFSSLASRWLRLGIAVLLTGMGNDGAKGLLQLKKAGWHTIAQDEASSGVYGMPRAAAELGAASQILPLNQIAYSLRVTLPTL